MLCSPQTRADYSNNNQRNKSIEENSNMKTITCLSLLVVLCQQAVAVTVTEGPYKFSLASVKELGQLMAREGVLGKDSLPLAEAKVQAVCAEPDLPTEFRPLCQSKDAGVSLNRLAFVAANSDACELCESVACTGC
ncbi:guanylate cyclase activator 2B-like [Lampris incognitus]|uniref:guanylate cyclase activator 2B-like n=1 Tax=Lampris incognitus TaxID=2546036 RepID=UPI0024B4CF31|nr:guanylate cyclase activator 2B-like [Lampris incognitus]